MLFKALVLLSAAMISRWNDTSIAESSDADSQVVIRG